MTSNKSLARVLVIGGGISGIETSLSLSRCGFGVYLVERMPSLGGMIPSLHRLYPICACCKLNPKIALCDQDPNIKVLTNTNVLEVAGTKGNFKAKLLVNGKKREIQVGSIVLASGTEAFDPSLYDTYSYGRYPNIITSVEYEQMQKPLGPEGGQIRRPSDGRAPQSIAWLQCVGSRDINTSDAPYCSTVCCMYALKEAVNTKDIDSDIETTIFYMDMRTHGKGFERYMNNATSRGVRLIRSRIHTIDQTDNDNLLIRYVDDKGEAKKEAFDLVVLSVGLRPSAEAIGLARRIGLKINTDGYVQTKQTSEVQTSKPGIYACGGITSPLDIKASITQASAVVSEIMSFLKPVPFTKGSRYPSLKAVDTAPRILVAYHACNGMDPEVGQKVKKAASKLSGVVQVVQLGEDLLGDLRKKLRETKANRVVFACCSPELHKALVEEALRSSGLNPYLYETVDLRVVGGKNEGSQLQDRVRAGVAKARLLSPPPLREVEVFKQALVVGGGLAGLQSALSIAKSGYKVTLVEKNERLGGHCNHVKSNWRGENIQDQIEKLIQAVDRNRKIKVLLNAEVKRTAGSPGHFSTIIRQADKEIEVLHGVTVLAIGANPIKPTEYLYGQHRNVFTWAELSQKLLDDPSFFKNSKVGVFIQCVGSREPDRPYCSNFCCTFAVRTAIDLMEMNPEMQIYILYRDIRTFGLKESLYRQAREKGVIFIRYETSSKPLVTAENGTGALKVAITDHILNRPISIEPDFISLQTAIAPNGSAQIAEIFGVDLDEDGFFAESPEKLKPVESTRPGVFLAGLAHYPKDTGDSLTQANAAAAKAVEILRKDTIEIGGRVAEVQPEKCAVCCTCVRTCPFHIPYIDHDRGAAYIDPGLCQGCGICVAECPGKAITMATCSDEMLNEAPAFLLGIS